MIGSDELYAQHRDEELAAELREKQDQQVAAGGGFCSHCQTNWADLHRAEGDGDEQYEFCPICRSDSYLEARHAGGAFVLSPFTGDIVDPITGEKKVFKVPEPPPMKAVGREFNEDTYNASRSRRHEEQDRAIADHQRAFDQNLNDEKK